MFFLFSIFFNSQTIQVLLLLNCSLQLPLFTISAFSSKVSQQSLHTNANENFGGSCLFEHVNDVDHLLRLGQELLKLLLLWQAAQS